MDSRALFIALMLLVGCGRAPLEPPTVPCPELCFACLPELERASVCAIDGGGVGCASIDCVVCGGCRYGN